MPEIDPQDEVVFALHRLFDQMTDPEIPPMSRISAVIAARTYLDALTRRMVNEAREKGSSWEELGVLFGTSAVNAKARYGDYNDYDD
ncbi:MAG TPA: hypothetical protein VM390_07245 [Acidimicrobiales bacterium]|nr:hypothetical protein [Acidimicrobiales bacterium]